MGNFLSYDRNIQLAYHSKPAKHIRLSMKTIKRWEKY